MTQPTAPNTRSFSLDSHEACDALCFRAEEPWIRNGSLPREPRARSLPVLRSTERSDAGAKRRRSSA